MRLIYMETK